MKLHAGWYKCFVSSSDKHGNANISYPKNKFETVDLRTINWKHARKSSKQYHPLSSAPPSYKPTKFSPSFFADDLTRISSNFSDRQEVKTIVDSHYSDLDLHFRPDTMSFSGKRFDHSAQVKLN